MQMASNHFFGYPKTARSTETHLLCGFDDPSFVLNMFRF